MKPENKPFTLLIGTPVWYHSQEFNNTYDRPRYAVIVEPGAQPNLANLKIFPGPVFDVQNARMMPMIDRRNVPVFQDYPKVWPTEPFAVFPTTARAPHLQGPILAGIRVPKLAGVTLTFVEPYLTPAQEPDGEPGNAADIYLDEMANRPHSTMADEGPGMASEPAALGSTGAPQVVSAPKIATKPKVVEPPKPPAASASLEGLDAPVMRLIKHPAWLREMDDIGKVLITCTPNTINLHSAAKLPLVTVTHEPTGPKAGYVLLAVRRLKGPMAEINAGIRTADAAREMIVWAWKIARAGMNAKTTREVVKAFDSVWEEPA